MASEWTWRAAFILEAPPMALFVCFCWFIPFRLRTKAKAGELPDDDDVLSTSSDTPPATRRSSAVVVAVDEEGAADKENSEAAAATAE